MIVDHRLAVKDVSDLCRGARSLKQRQVVVCDDTVCEYVFSATDYHV